MGLLMKENQRKLFISWVENILFQPHTRPSSLLLTSEATRPGWVVGRHQEVRTNCILWPYAFPPPWVALGVKERHHHF